MHLLQEEGDVLARGLRVGEVATLRMADITIGD